MCPWAVRHGREIAKKRNDRIASGHPVDRELYLFIDVTPTIVRYLNDGLIISPNLYLHECTKDMRDGIFDVGTKSSGYLRADYRLNSKRNRVVLYDIIKYTSQNDVDCFFLSLIALAR